MKKFVIISDTHFYVDDKVKHGTFWNRSLPEKRDEIAASLIETVKKLRPDYIVHCGDFVDRAYLDCFEYGKNIMDAIGVPWFLVPGNHDAYNMTVRNEISKLYGLPLGQSYFSRIIGDIKHVFLDTCFSATLGNEVIACRDENLHKAGMLKGLVVPKEELDWLEEELKTSKNEAVFIFSHVPIEFKCYYPVSCLPDGTKLDDMRGFSINDLFNEINISLVNSDSVSSVLKKHKNVKAVFSGHWHINDHFENEGIHFIQTASLREYPFEIRIVEIDEGEIHISTVPLSDSELAVNSYIKHRKNDWVRGTDSDRNIKFFAKT